MGGGEGKDDGNADANNQSSLSQKARGTYGNS